MTQMDPSAVWAAVVGGMNMDVGGRPDAALIANDSNPGRVRLSPGGVGRNIAHNLALLGVDARMLTVLGEDLYAQRLAASCAEAGIDLTQSLRLPGESTSTYLYILDERGDMALALSDMAIYRRLTPEALAPRLPWLNSASVIVLDANIPSESIVWLCEHAQVPVFADPVSVTKADRLADVLPRLHTLKPNRLEAERLTGVAITDEKSARRAADALLKAGLQRVFLSLGSEGVLAADHRGQVFLPALDAKVVNATGGGDAFMAGLVWAYLRGESLAGSARAGLAAAALALESAETVNPNMSRRALCRRLEAFNIQ